MGFFLIALQFSFALAEPGETIVSRPYVTIGDVVKPASINQQLFERVSEKPILNLEAVGQKSLSENELGILIGRAVPGLRNSSTISSRDLKEYHFSYKKSETSEKIDAPVITKPKCWVLNTSRKSGQIILQRHLTAEQCTARPKANVLKFDESHQVITAAVDIGFGETIGAFNLDLFVNFEKGESYTFRKDIGRFVIEKPVTVTRSSKGKFIPVKDSNDRHFYARDYELIGGGHD